MKLALRVNYTKIIKLTWDIAEREYAGPDISQVQNYYVLVILMAGVIDDVESALN